MAAHQMINIEMNANVRVLLQIANMSAISISRTIDEPQHVLGKHQRGITDIRIFRKASLETQGACIS